MAKVHLYSIKEDIKIPSNNIAKTDGFKASICGYQRKFTTENKKDVTCKICLKEIAKIENR